jgi:hypothetical protein
MTEWHKLSPSRQHWTVYRLVRKLEPSADLEMVRDTLVKEFGVRMKLRWCQIHLKNFESQNMLRTEIIDGKKFWFSTGEHERN